MYLIYGVVPVIIFIHDHNDFNGTLVKTTCVYWFYLKSLLDVYLFGSDDILVYECQGLYNSDFPRTVKIRGKLR